MTTKRTTGVNNVTILFWLFGFFLLLLVAGEPIGAQCAMCKANVANAENAAEVSARVNRAVLVLLFPTFLLLGGIVRLIFNYRNFHSHSDYDDQGPARAQRGSQ
jgi:hypothetical protein